MAATRRKAIDAHRRFCCPVPLTTPAPVHACRSCGRRQITDQEGRRRIPSARFCEFPAPHSPSPSILPLSRRLLYTDLTCLTATQLWQHPAWRAAWRLDMSTAGQPGEPVASVTRRPVPNPGRGRGFAPSHTSVRPDHRRLAARCDHRATQSRIVSTSCPHFEVVLGQNSERCRSCAVSPYGVAIMPVRLRLQTTAHTPARVRRAPEASELSSGVGVFLVSRQFMSGLLAEPVPCTVDHLNAPTPGIGTACQLRRSASSRGPWPNGARPHRGGDADNLAPVDIPSAQPPAILTEIQSSIRPLERLE
jgi:hypothetical protein